MRAHPAPAERRTPLLARWLSRSIVPLAVLGNIGAYWLSLYLLEAGASGDSAQLEAWRVVTVTALVSFQAVWLVWLRPQPVGTFLGSVGLWAAAIVVGGYGPLAVQPGLLFAVFAVMTERSGWVRPLLIGTGITAASVALVGTDALSSLGGGRAWDAPPTLLRWALAAAATIGAPALAGIWYASLRDRAERIAELAQRVASGEAVRTAEAVAAERRTLAQEIHDTSSAHLAALLALSTAAESTALAGGRSHARLISQIRGEGERLYQGFERMLNSMRQEDRTVTESFQSGHRPGQHSVAEVRALASEHRADTGGAVEVRHEPGLEEIAQRLGPMRAHIAYRVVQEALSNVRKHATEAEVGIIIEDDGAAVLIRIENGEPPSPRGTDASEPRSLSLGYGLEGMRDRLVAAGGSLRTGPRQNGGWSVNALLPHPPHQRASRQRTLEPVDDLDLPDASETPPIQGVAS